MKRASKPPRDGTHQERFADGSVSEEGRYADGKRSGVWKYYYLRTRVVKATGRFTGGVMTGTWTWRRENGELLQTGGFADGKQTGVWKRYRADGTLLDERVFVEGKRTKTVRVPHDTRT